MSFKPTPIADPALQPLIEIQENLRIELEDLEDTKLSNRVLVVATLGVTPLKVHHGLGHPVTTWEVVRKNAAGDVYEGAAAADPTKDIMLVASATVTVTVRFT